jgi:polar amino acid transport system substrate-binding protein
MQWQRATALRGGAGRRRAAVLAFLATVSLGAAACGSSTSTTTTTASPSGTTNPYPAPSGIPSATTSSMLHNELPAAFKGKTLVVALDATYPPDEMMQGNTVIGMDADFAYSIGQVLGVKVSLVNATFDGIIPGLLSGKYDIGDSSFTDTKAREKQVDFVDYFQAGEGFYEAANNSVSYNGLASLCNHTVAVEAGTTELSDAQSQGKKCKVTVLTFQTQTAANLAVSTGKAQIGFVDSQVAGYIVKESKGQFKLTGTPIEVAPYGIAVPKGGLDTPLLGAINELMSDGVYAKILAKWGLQAGAISTPAINGALS